MASGPSTTEVKSSTRMPASGPVAAVAGAGADAAVAAVGWVGSGVERSVTGVPGSGFGPILTAKHRPAKDENPSRLFVA